MKIRLLFIFLSLSALNSSAQSAWKDTLKTTVNLKSFKLTNKIVRAEYGRVIMYFNQADYFKKQVKEDTVRITPKYFSEETISYLLKKGRVKIVRRSDNLPETEIIHYLKRFGSQCDRIFELHDGVSFFMHLEIFGIMSDHKLDFSFDPNNKRKDTIIQRQVKDFAYPEEFPNKNDNSIIKIKDYFPSKPSYHYVYNDNNKYGELDTTICKIRELNGQSVFYFAECFNKYKIVGIHFTMFGPGIYYYQNDSLFTIEADYESDIEEKDFRRASLLIPSKIKCGDSSAINLGINDQVFTFLKKEDLKIGTTIHKDCIKLKIKEYWPETIYIAYIWLKKDFGLVKWMRFTGKVEEIVSGF